jgi:hypothetical protein
MTGAWRPVRPSKSRSGRAKLEPVVGDFIAWKHCITNHECPRAAPRDAERVGGRVADSQWPGRWRWLASVENFLNGYERAMESSGSPAADVTTAGELDQAA